MTPPSMLDLALEYAAQGLEIVPGHEPIFDNAGNCTGCTCEAYKRSDKYRRWLDERGMGSRFDPNFKCSAPGKHPHLSDWQNKATNDPEIIRQWWSRWPTANIGHNPGRAKFGAQRRALIMVDGDTYKAHYAGDGLALPTNTPAALTGNLGSHDYFYMPVGKEYGQHTGNLPEGVDIRGVNGYDILPGSVHPSGRRYEWKIGRSLSDVQPQELPQHIVAILDAAQRKTPVASVQLGTPSAQKPDLAAWGLSDHILAAIHHPAEKGQRSEADWRVTVELVRAGASEQTILDVFTYFAIGNQGKYAERGDDYLVRTIAHARSYVAEHPYQRPNLRAEVEGAPGVAVWKLIEAGEAWILTADCAKALAEPDKGRLEDLRRSLCALLKEARKKGRLVFESGLRPIGKNIKVAHQTIKRHLPVLAEAGLIEFEKLGEGKSTRFNLKFVIAKCYTPETSTTPLVLGVTFGDDKKCTTFYHDHLPDEAFHSCQYRPAIERNVNAYGCDTVLADSLGVAAALVWHDLEEHGDSTNAEIAERRGMKLGTVARAIRKLKKDGFVIWVSGGGRIPRGYELHPDAEARLDERRPAMKTHLVCTDREFKDARRSQAQIEGILKDVGEGKREVAEEFRDKLYRRLNRVKKDAFSAMRILRPSWTGEEIWRFIDDPLPAAPHPAQVAKLERKVADVRMDLAEQRLKGQWEITRNLEIAIQDLVRAHVPKRQWFDDLLYAGFTPGEAKSGLAAYRAIAQPVYGFVAMSA